MTLLNLFSVLAILGSAYFHWFLNRERGASDEESVLKLSEWQIWVIWSMITTLIFCHFIVVPVLLAIALVTAGYFIHYAPGWGKWWPQAKDTSMEKEIQWIDWLTSKIVGYKYTSSTKIYDVIKYKRIAFNLRFGMYSIPLYATLAWLTNSFIPLIAIIPMFYAGNIYKHGFRDQFAEDSTVWSEHHVGLMVGVTQALIGIIMWILYLIKIA